MDELDERVELIPLGEAKALAATEFAKQLLETAVELAEPQAVKEAIIAAADIKATKFFIITISLFLA